MIILFCLTNTNIDMSSIFCRTVAVRLRKYDFSLLIENTNRVVSRVVQRGHS